MNERLTRRLLAHGRVQGVWFRESLRREAQSLGVSGWVRNRQDGTVEAVVQGAAAAVERVIAWARRGPEAAKVARLDVEPAEGEFEGFERRPDA